MLFALTLLWKLTYVAGSIDSKCTTGVNKYITMLRTRSSLLVSFFFFFVFAECTEANIDNIELVESENEQEIISKIISSRAQILDVVSSDSIIIFIYQNDSISIETKLFPFVSLNEHGNWIVNGEVMPNKASKNSCGKVVFPTLEIASDGHLVVDGQKSLFYWNATSRKLISDNSSRIWAVSKADSYLCFYSTDDTTILPIADSPNYVIPDYFFNLVVQKELQAEEYIKEIPDECRMTYVFFTDAHWGRNQKHSPAIIKHIVDYTPINLVLFGGDVNTNHTKTIQETINIGNQFHYAFSFLGSKLYCLFGNHDDNSTGQPSLTERHLSEEQVYAYLQSQMTNVHYWDYYNFLFDDSVSRTRFICMDTGRLYIKDYRGAIVKTAKFAIESLSAVPDGWHIVAASHIWTNLKSFETGEMKESAYVRPIIEILENYNMREKSTFKYGGEILDYDFTHAGATIEYCIGGHTHCDGVVMSEKGLPLIIITCDGQQEVAGRAPFKTGTVDEQCVTIVVNDYRDRKVQIYHIGRGNDTSVPMWEAH